MELASERKTAERTADGTGVGEARMPGQNYKAEGAVWSVWKTLKNGKAPVQDQTVELGLGRDAEWERRRSSCIMSAKRYGERSDSG